jgi:hypothetical protein
MIKKILLFLLILIIGLDAKKIGTKQRILVSQIAPDTYRMRIYMNYENPFATYQNLERPINKVILNIPLPDRFEVIKIRKYLTYKTGLSVNPDSSYILEMVNDNVVFQAPLITELGAGSMETISYEIPADKLYEGYNSHTTLIIQNGIIKGGGGGSSVTKIQQSAAKLTALNLTEHVCGVKKSSGAGSGGGGGAKVWTQIYTEDSYIEYDFKLKPFEEKVNSLFRFIIDNKSLLPSRINLVMPELLTENDLNNYGLFANILGYLLKFRDVKFSVSTKINNHFNNIIIMPRDKVKILLDGYIKDNNITFAQYSQFVDPDILKNFQFTFDNQIQGNINVIQNPKNNKYGFFILTGDNQQEIESAIFTLTDPSLNINRAQKLVTKNIKRPLKAKPFTAPNFIEFGKSIDLINPKMKNQKTCSDTYLTTYETSFQVYPVLAKTAELRNYNMKVNIDYFSINSDNIIFLFNIYLNGILTQQFFQQKKLQTNSGILQEQGQINMALLKEGWNNLRVEIVKYPAKENVPYGLEAIKTKIEDTSKIFIPKIIPRVKYPNVKYVRDMGFPFSIYADLQNTGILITNFKAETIAAAMKVAFMLGEKVAAPGYYLTTTYNINGILDKDMIIIGEEIPELEPVYSKAPVHFQGNSVKIKKYVAKYDKILELKEYSNFEHALIIQMYQSIFNPKRVIVEISAQDPKTIYKGVQEGLTPKNMGNMNGDVWIYNVDKKIGSSFQFQKPYLIDNILENYKIDFNQIQYKNIEEF